MRKPFWEVRVPTLFGILLIIIGTAITSYLVKTGVIFIGRASPADIPSEVRITNITDSSFSVTYTTAEAVTGVVSFGKDTKLGQTALDDRDQLSGTIRPYKVHHITIRNLQAETPYHFSITSGGNTYTNQVTEEPFTVTTGTTITTEPTTQEPISGTVNTPSGTPAQDALVYLSNEQTQTVSTLVKANGSYILPLNVLRKVSLKEYASLSGTSTIKLLAVGEGAQTTATLLISQIHPVPAMTLSQSYDFTISQIPIASVSGNFGFPTFTATQSANKSPRIITPEKDERFTDNKPQFRGTTTPNATVKIAIHSETAIEEQVKANAQGVWTYRPTQALAPGPHTITITAPDQFGILKTITQSFTVYAAGSQLSETATPSETPKATSTPTPTTAQKVATPTPSPTTVLSTTNVSPAITVVPTLPIGGIITSPTPTHGVSLVSPSATSAAAPIPAVGSSTTIIAGIAGTLTFAVGIFLFIATHGSLL